MKKKKKKMKMRAKLQLLMMDEKLANNYDPENNEYDMKELSSKFDKRIKKDWKLRWLIKKKTKQKLEEMDDFHFNFQDNRFQSLYHDPNYALDKTNTHYKKNNVNNNNIEQSRKQRKS